MVVSSRMVQIVVPPFVPELFGCTGFAVLAPSAGFVHPRGFFAATAGFWLRTRGSLCGSVCDTLRSECALFATAFGAAFFLTGFFEAFFLEELAINFLPQAVKSRKAEAYIRAFPLGAQGVSVH